MPRNRPTPTGPGSLAAALLALLPVACGAPGGPSGSVPGTLKVEAVEVSVMESLPVQVVAHVTGRVPDVCTSVASVRQSRDGRRITVTIATVRPEGACILLLPPPVQLPVRLEGDFGPGEYVVRVNTHEVQFSI